MLAALLRPLTHSMACWERTEERSTGLVNTLQGEGREPAIQLADQRSQQAWPTDGLPAVAASRYERRRHVRAHPTRAHFWAFAYSRFQGQVTSPKNWSTWHRKTCDIGACAKVNHGLAGVCIRCTGSSCSPRCNTKSTAYKTAYARLVGGPSHGAVVVPVRHEHACRRVRRRGGAQRHFARWLGGCVAGRRQS